MKQFEQNITFELNEKLSFETGQEIDKMISISLDPDIVIQAYDEYIQIRGVVLLLGEYHRRNKRDHHDQVNHQQHVDQYIEKVINLDDSVASFSHRFPIEISVTKERVTDIEDVTVKIEAFDYDLPSSDTLNVFASLHINGVTPEQQAELPQDNTGLMVAKEKTANQDVQATKETKQQTNEEKQDHKPSDTAMVGKHESTSKEQVNEVKQDAVPSDEAKRKIENPPHETTNEERRLRLIKDDSNVVENYEFNEETGVQSQEEPNQSTQSNEEKSVVEAVAVGEEETAQDSSNTEQIVEVSRLDNQEMQIELTEGKEDEDSEVKDLTFLTELFEEGEETYTQMTIYIAQEEDSPESIAKRYDIPVLQLLKDNNLSADTIEAGQLIRIRQHSLS